MNNGVILGRGGEGCIIQLNETEVAKVLFLEPQWRSRDLSHSHAEADAKYMQIQSTLREIDPEEDYFIPTKRLVNAPLQTLPNEIQSSIRACWNGFREQQGTRDALMPTSVIPMYIQTKVVPTDVLSFDEEDCVHVWNAVRLLHENGLAHGDIHEKNFARNAKGLPVLIDFDQASKTQYEMPHLEWNPTYQQPILIQAKNTQFRSGKSNFSDFQDLQKVFDAIRNSKVRT